ncbi:rust resistance kinase Lr10-like [Dendrobium catenatum]|nr:rust resistance kinase Lr10-like [Dendrobium catenatum]XP_028552943.1 rust resistance kinase Lr10-like [Dendrobium catenatum]XP_028552944.1 rust resistance kinase Lr10-like [Dendrobium catenatum]XP_028552945.1 rust resistance kinase Lr10-like [Dendrobium catenatum]XP_028552946.1 rust resistance kinase Lr10-like [Dendrobium catenatum]XP_028552947.1 rust resistance kinase Lr10-like [Dendrobium catenatum]XP_028552948.1 rust resistance kinase Lr10-like [Dendrobium catenatum]
MHFPACIEDYTGFNSHFQLIFRLSIVVIVIIEIVHLVIVLLIIGRLVFAPLALWTFLAHKFWTILSSDDAVEKFLQAQQSLSPTRYAYTDIIALTRHFKEQLGRGGFGSVYKGELPGSHFVAVKLLSAYSKCHGDDFISEVSTIGRIHHLNVIRLVGFCSEGSKAALVYEYMPNKSLDKYIFSSNRCFSWQKLNTIALGVARGVDYLHRGCDMTILHFDIKPQNILLDQTFVPKVSDFGLAKLYPKEYNVVSVSAARGTIGYIAPELVSRNFGIISHKSDVYSFGMLLIEMASGRRNVDTNADSSSQNYYPSLIYDKLSYKAKEEIKFESLEMNEVEKKLYLVGLWCIQIRPSDRPSMNQVVQMIEGDADHLELPPKPFFSWSSSISRTLHSDSTATTQLSVIGKMIAAELH